jgi:hypothetical protein
MPPEAPKTTSKRSVRVGDRWTGMGVISEIIPAFTIVKAEGKGKEPQVDALLGQLEERRTKTMWAGERGEQGRGGV